MPSQGDSVASVVNPWTMQRRVGLMDGRYALNSMLMPISGLSYIDYRSGVMASGDTAGIGGSSHMAMRVKPGDGMSVTVEPGNAVINTPNYGAYMACLDSRKTLALDPASTSTNRIDVVIARIYDDRNPAIGSPENERRFTVEVWKGDESTGTPTRPTPTPAAGWIPLAAVYIGQGVGALSASNITDLRGPGLVSRGGMRALYGADADPDSEAFQEPGAYPGDQRWVHTSGFQHQVYYGDNDDPTKGGWRGVHNALVFNATPSNPATDVWQRTTGTVTEICRVTIPYPGTPFMIFPTGRVMAKLSKTTVVDMRISLNTATGPIVSWDRVDSGNAAASGVADTRQGFNIAPVEWGPFTDSVDVVLNGFVYYAANSQLGWCFSGSDRVDTLLSVEVKPSTVQPPMS